MRFGDTRYMQELHVGDRYPWIARKQPQNGGRPDSGSTEGEGYMECERCHRDSFLRVVVREDVIIKVEPDVQRRGDVPD